MFAVRILGAAHIAPMPDQTMRKRSPLFARQNLHQIALDLDGVGGERKSEPPCQAGDMGIDHHADMYPEGTAENDIGSLARDAGQCA